MSANLLDASVANNNMVARAAYRKWLVQTTIQPAHAHQEIWFLRERGDAHICRCPGCGVFVEREMRCNSMCHRCPDGRATYFCFVCCVEMPGYMTVAEHGCIGPNLALLAPPAPLRVNVVEPPTPAEPLKVKTPKVLAVLFGIAAFCLATALLRKPSIVS